MMDAPCPICGGMRSPQRVMDLPELSTKEVFTLNRCSECTVIRTSPVPEELGTYYESDMGRSMKVAPSNLHRFMKSVLMRIELRRITRRVQPAAIVDYGCGTGDFVREIHKRGLTVVAVDAAPERPIDIADTDEIPYYQTSFDDYRIEGLESFGGATVILRHVLEHVKRPSECLARLASYGAAFFYIAVPNTACLERRVFGEYWNLWDPPRHLWHLNLKALQSLSRRTGMKILAHGCDTIPNIVPSFYRYLRLKGAPAWMVESLGPKGTLSSLSSPLNVFLPGNVVWILAKAGGA